MHDDPATARVRRLEEQLRVLTDATRAFADASNDPTLLLDAVAREVADIVGDGCIVLTLAGDGSALVPVAMHDRDPRALDSVRMTIQNAPLRLAEHPRLKRVVEMREPLSMARVDREALRPPQTTPGYFALLTELNVTSLLVLPLVYQERTVGALVMARRGDQSPCFDESDTLFARAIADQAALAFAQSRALAAAREARETLRRSEEQWRQLFQESPAPMLVLDLDSLAFLTVNDAACRLYGYTREEFAALHARELSADRGLDAGSIKGDAATFGSAELSGIVRHGRKDGTRVVLEYRAREIWFGGSRARLCILNDVTDDRRLIETRALLAAIVEFSNDAIMSKTIDGTIMSWNHSAELLFGFSASEAIGNNVRMILPEDRLDEEDEFIRRLLSGDRIAHEETVRRRKDGSLVFVSVTLSPIRDERGRVVGASKVVRDLTAQRSAADALRRAEEQLRQAQKMEAVGRLAGGVAHDFNNVLSVILSHGEMLLESPAASDDMRDELLEICGAGRRAAELTKQLLMFSRQQVLEPRVLDLNAMLEAMDKMLRRMVGEDVKVLLQTAPGIGRIRADPGSIDQVIMNLVVNARDAMPLGGTVMLATNSRYIGPDDVERQLGAVPGPHVVLTVRDTGVGMDRDTLTRIFEPFFTTKGAGRGTGLGLSTVFGIVRQSGGLITARSELGKGSTFTVLLPEIAFDPEVESRSRLLAQVAPSPRGHETILLVEDEAPVRNAARAILQRHGYRVLETDTAEHALAVCDQHAGAIDLLVTDVVMPQMSGPELARKLMQRRPAIKVLFVSGYTDDAAIRHGVFERGLNYLQKPLTVDSLTLKVRQVLQG